MDNPPPNSHQTLKNMKRDLKLINTLKKMSDFDLSSLKNLSLRLQVYYFSIANIRAGDREIYIQEEISKELSRRSRLINQLN